MKTSELLYARLLPLDSQYPRDSIRDSDLSRVRLVCVGKRVDYTSHYDHGGLMTRLFDHRSRTFRTPEDWRRSYGRFRAHILASQDCALASAFCCIFIDPYTCIALHFQSCCEGIRR